MLTSVQNVCVVTTFYTLESMKSILLPKFVFFSFKATPFSQKYKFIILLVYLFFMGCCTSYYNIPSAFLWSERELDRNVFLRKYWFFDTISDIAERYSMRENTVKSMLFRTRNRLREFLRKEGIEV